MDSGTPKRLQRRGSRANIGIDVELYRPEFGYGEGDTPSKKDEKLWELMSSYQGSDMKSIQRSIVNHVEYTLARTRFNFESKGAYQATAFSIRDRLIESWNDTQQHFTSVDTKRVYYLSMEFLLGRLMQNALINLDIENNYKDALLDLGYKLEDIYEEEVDPALGNGGLGRLAACFLDSMASLDYPAWGYGLRYNYGIFRQAIVKGYQCELPDYWLKDLNPWEIERDDIQYKIRFYGHIRKYKDARGIERSIWEGGEEVLATAFDIPIPGWDTFNTINLRLWKSGPSNEFDFSLFNHGDYFKAVESRQRAEYITSVLYPNDNTMQGKELRLKQEYFFVAATIKDVLRRFGKKSRDWSELPEKVAIQLNDTHPAIGIPELLRVLIDEEHMEWSHAWDLVNRTFAYTNHTVLPEALEKWSVDLLQHLLPRHLEIIYLINFYFLESVKKQWPDKPEVLTNMSLIEESTPKMVRMANLCIVSSHAVNGVAELHSNLIKSKLFKLFHQFFPGKFQNKTNGVTPRRWIYCANRPLADLITRYLGDNQWLHDLDLLGNLNPYQNDPDFVRDWKEVKMTAKKGLAEWVKKNCGFEIPTDSLYDVMVKRIHEYKRQLLNALYCIHRYLSIKDMTKEERQHVVPRVTFCGGKAAPGYYSAKKIIKLFNSISDVVNNDPDIGDLFKVVFLPNYCVSAAQVIIPAAELNQHISTAGTEASGTSNMKFAMNGGLIIGTMDGANVEIAEECGVQNMFIFGADVKAVHDIRSNLHKGGDVKIGTRLKRVLETIKSGRFGDAGEYSTLVDPLFEGNDFYLVCHDFYSYVEAQEKVDESYKKPEEWWAKSIAMTAGSGKFSSDRTIREYAEQIWGLEPCSIPKPSLSAMQRIRSFPNMIKQDEHNQHEHGHEHDGVNGQAPDDDKEENKDHDHDNDLSPSSKKKKGKKDKKKKHEDD
eukprot:CAMPEP_0115014494 /NCGR_PEP_ID=MMETSP0216-20121206/26115_1 /TAXON_ID=223996 /ORGANISM="Protocruzia adherens, Strain Boccale" /LENGTH=939 /DNA_ID=CAMNT_0002384251 /DNA_START=165 /DNA_END=2984 /DNA_ORIENTATION=+